MFLTTSGDLGIGDIGDPSAKLEIFRGATNEFALKLTSSSLGLGSGAVFSNTTPVTGRDYSLYASSAGNLHFADQTSQTDRMVIRSDGNVGIGVTNPGNKLQVNGNVCAANIACASDARLKTQITGLRYGLSHLMRLRPVSWQWKDATTNQLPIGLVAQEVEPVIPELVLRSSGPAGPLGLNYMGLVPVLVNAVQEQQATLERKESEIQSANAEIKAIKAENQTLNARLAAIEQLLQQLKEQAGKQTPPKPQ